MVASFMQANSELKDEILYQGEVIEQLETELTDAALTLSDAQDSLVIIAVRALAAEEQLATIRMMHETEMIRYQDMQNFITRVAESGNINLTKDEIAIWAEVVIRAGAKYNIDPRVLVGVAYRESRLGTYSRSRQRPLTVEEGEMEARVLGDYRNGVWRSCGAFQVQFRYHPESCEELMSVRTGAIVAARLLNELRNTCDSRFYLAAYNGGCRNKDIGPTRGYQRRVMEVASR